MGNSTRSNPFEYGRIAQIAGCKWGYCRLCAIVGGSQLAQYINTPVNMPLTEVNDLRPRYMDETARLASRCRVQRERKRRDGQLTGRHHKMRGVDGREPRSRPPSGQSAECRRRHRCCRHRRRNLVLVDVVYGVTLMDRGGLC